MPGIVLKGAGGGRGRKPVGAPQAGSSFQDALTQAIQGGDSSALEGILRAGQVGFSPAYQSGRWRPGAENAATQQIASAIRSLRAGSGGLAAMQQAEQAAYLLGRVGGLTPAVHAGLGAMRAVAGRTGVGGGLVPYRPPPLPVPYRSRSTAFDMVGLPYTPASTSASRAAYRVGEASFGVPAARQGSEAVLSGIYATLKESLKVEKDTDHYTRRIVSFVATGAGRGGAGSAFGGGFGGGGGSVPPGVSPGSAPGGGSFSPGGGFGPAFPMGGPMGRMRRSSSTSQQQRGRLGGVLGGLNGGSFGIGHPLASVGGILGGIGGGALSLLLGPEAVPLGAVSGYELGHAVGRFAEKVATTPQEAAAKAASFLASATPVMDLKSGTYGMGRTGAFGGRGIMSTFFAGGGMPMPWESAYGLGPGEAFGMLQNFGITPFSSSGGKRTVEALARGNFYPGTSNLGGAAQASVQLMGRYGLLGNRNGPPSPESIDHSMQQLSNILESAVQRGMDRASVLRSIDASVSTAARSGALTVGRSSAASFLMRFANMPGGRTGEFGMKVAAGLQSAADMVGHNPMQTMMYASAVPKYQTDNQLKSLLGADNFSNLMSDPAGRRLISLYRQASSTGDTYSASVLLSQITQGYDTTGNAKATILRQSPYYVGLTPPRKVLAEAGVMHTTPIGAIGLDMNPARRIGAGRAGMSLGPGADNATGFNPGKEDSYRAGLRRMGVKPSLIDTVIDRARHWNVNPIMIGAQMMKESSGGYDTSIGAYGISAATNVMQIDPKSGQAAPTSVYQSIDTAAKMDKGFLDKTGSIYQASSMYNTGGEDWHPWVDSKGVRHDPYQEYWKKEQNWLVAGGVTGNIPNDVLSAKSNAQQVMYAGSATSFHEMATTLTVATNAVSSFSSALSRAVRILNRLTPPNGAANAVQ